VIANEPARFFNERHAPAVRDVGKLGTTAPCARFREAERGFAGIEVLPTRRFARSSRRSRLADDPRCSEGRIDRRGAAPQRMAAPAKLTGGLEEKLGRTTQTIGGGNAPAFITPRRVAEADGPNRIAPAATGPPESSLAGPRSRDRSTGGHSKSRSSLNAIDLVAKRSYG